MTAIAPEVREPLILRSRLGDPRTVSEMIASTDALVHGHFELLGGDHTDAFIKFSRIAERPAALETTTQWLLPSVAAWLPDSVLAPATAGVALGWTLARRLGLPLVLADVGANGRAAAVHDAGSLRDQRVLLINDVVTTGHGIAALAHVANEAGATVAGATWFLSRGDANVSEMIGAPVSCIGDLLLSRWSSPLCPLCTRDEPLTRAVEIN
jgi:orotate phosphoribosyltransferase